MSIPSLTYLERINWNPNAFSNVLIIASCVLLSIIEPLMYLVSIKSMLSMYSLNNNNNSKKDNKTKIELRTETIITTTTKTRQQYLGKDTDRTVCHIGVNIHSWYCCWCCCRLVRIAWYGCCCCYCWYYCWRFSAGSNNWLTGRNHWHLINSSIAIPVVVVVLLVVVLLLFLLLEYNCCCFWCCWTFYKTQQIHSLEQ